MWIKDRIWENLHGNTARSTVPIIIGKVVFYLLKNRNTVWINGAVALRTTQVGAVW